MYAFFCFKKEAELKRIVKEIDSLSNNLYYAVVKTWNQKYGVAIKFDEIQEFYHSLNKKQQEAFKKLL